MGGTHCTDPVKAAETAFNTNYTGKHLIYFRKRDLNISMVQDVFLMAFSETGWRGLWSFEYR